MERVILLIPLVLFPFNIYSQQQYDDTPTIPERCEMRDHMNRQCCLFPPFFDRDTAKNCGGRFSILFTNHRANASGFRRTADVGCRYWRCILKRYDLVSQTDEKRLDDVRFYEHLNAWVELNPEFKNAMFRAKMECKQSFQIGMPLMVCDFFRLNLCIRSFINVNCPKFIETEECKETKKFFEECREYYE